MASAAADDNKAPLLPDLDTVDFDGHPAVRSKYGTWKSARFIIGVEMAERIALYGIGDNLISYLTGPLGQPTAVAA
ncbi:NRT1/ PTR FAMILY 5.10-like protein [Drosera capensis]